MLEDMFPAPIKAVLKALTSKTCSVKSGRHSIHARWLEWPGSPQDDRGLTRRGPKIAVPMRTMVLPAAIAASRSADMPTDRVSIAG